MLITGISLSQYRDIVSTVSHAAYDDNVIVHSEYSELSDNRFRARHRVLDSRGSGARTAASGRLGPYACWHTTRDILQAVFEMNPNARVQSALATYRGVDDFETSFPDTYWTTVGSMMSPVYFGSLCDC